MVQCRGKSILVPAKRGVSIFMAASKKIKPLAKTLARICLCNVSFIEKNIALRGKDVERNWIWGWGEVDLGLDRGLQEEFVQAWVCHSVSLPSGMLRNCVVCTVLWVQLQLWQSFAEGSQASGGGGAASRNGTCSNDLVGKVSMLFIQLKSQLSPPQSHLHEAGCSCLLHVLAAQRGTVLLHPCQIRSGHEHCSVSAADTDSAKQLQHLHPSFPLGCLLAVRAAHRS